MFVLVATPVFQVFNAFGSIHASLIYNQVLSDLSQNSEQWRVSYSLGLICMPLNLNLVQDHGKV